MSSSEIAVIVWTVQAGVGVLFSAAMIWTRHRNRQALERSTGNGDRDDRIFLAQQDIRRSLVRYLSFLAAFMVGFLFVLTTHTDWLDDPPAFLMRHWIWLLVTVMTLTTANEIGDRWALSRTRRMYRHRHREYHPDALEGNEP